MTKQWRRTLLSPAPFDSTGPVKRMTIVISRRIAALVLLLAAFAATAFGQADPLQNVDLEAEYMIASSRMPGVAWEERVRLVSQAQKLAHKHGAMRTEGRAFNALGLLYEDKSNYEEAERHYTKALKCEQLTKDVQGEMATSLNLANVYVSLSRSEKAFPLFMRALEMASDLESRAEILASIGSMYTELGDYASAVDWFHRALAISGPPVLPTTRAIALNSIGVAYTYMKFPKEAIPLQMEALKIWSNSGPGYDRDLGTVLNNLGTAHLALKDYKKAIDHFTRGLALRRKAGDRYGEAATLGNLGTAYADKQEPRVAVNYYLAALSLQRAVGDRSGEARTLANLMRCMSFLDQPSMAIFYGKEAVNIRQDIRNRLTAFTPNSLAAIRSSSSRGYRELASLLAIEGRLAEGQQVLNLLKDDEFFRFVRGDGLKQSARRADLTPLESSLKKSFDGALSHTKELVQQAMAIEAKGFESPSSAAKLRAANVRVQQGSALFSALVRNLEKSARQGPKGASRLEVVRDSEALASTLARLPVGTVALYTVIGDQALTTVVVSRNATVARTVKVQSGLLYQRILDFREALQDPEKDPRPLGKYLYGLLVAPIEADLKLADAQTLMWSFDGPLRYIPVDALFDGKRYLIESYATCVFTVASLARLERLPERGTPMNALALGVSKEHRNFPPMAGVPDELDGVLRAVPGTRLLDEQFTRDALLASLADGYSVVHMASHFSFAPGGTLSDSYLLLGDGKTLSLAELGRMPSQLFTQVRMLTLSGCDTAIGSPGADGSEVEGLAVLAQRKGAEAVIAALWPVYDRSTTLLMEEFYKTLAADPLKSKLQSLRDAQISLLHGVSTGGVPSPVGSSSPVRSGQGFVKDPSKPFAHPYYWAPFVLMGNWQ
jgi:CHAT domain-containing protein/tetratricopeptide (TPR) repeat protein